MLRQEMMEPTSADRKAATLLVWAANEAAAGKSTGALRPLLEKLPGEWAGVAQRALSKNGGADFMAALAVEVQTHPERIRLEAALTEAKAAAEASDLDLIHTLPRSASAPRRTEIVQLENAPGPITPTWPILNPNALYGLPGDLVRQIEPHTEADPVALLVQTLIAAGRVIGPGPHFRVENDVHRVNLFTVLVGATSKGRKGSSWGHVRQLFATVDPDWSEAGGLSSGEGLIWAVRDRIEKTEPIREKKLITGYQTVIEDPGITDKRLLVLESEFASVLHVVGRDGNNLSAVIRQAWDNGNLRSLTKNSPAKATGAHISIIGHITLEELRRYLTKTEMGNGFANRFLWVCVRRSKTLPEGGNLRAVDLGPIVRKLTEAVEFARQVDQMNRDDPARALWREVYGALSEGRTSLLGAVTSRAEAQVMRLSCVYALLDNSSTIRRDHLEAALALWEYCAASARFVFGDSLGDPVAEQILQALPARPTGMTRTEISNLFQRNVDANRISTALRKLQELGLAWSRQEETGGRPVERWYSATAATR